VGRAPGESWFEAALEDASLWREAAESPGRAEEMGGSIDLPLHNNPRIAAQALPMYEADRVQIIAAR
jgi:hypothetical protein